MMATRESTTTEPAPPACSSCGSPLQATGLGLLCPACLMERVVSANTAETPAEARLFGEYQLMEEIGRGGVGVVYSAWHSRLERTVALKMLLGGPFAGPELTARFAREVRMAARLRHPGIVALFEAGDVEGASFFTMELIEGRTLSACVRDGPMKPRQAAQYVRKAARAVQHAHENEILHLDLKPSNILIDSFDEPKVADFGLARLWHDGTEQTVNIHAMGSPPYMAPEQLSGDRSLVGPSADVYALGAVLFHVLTGRPPYVGASVEDIFVQVRESTVVAPHLLNPAVPPDLETICLKCLEKDPGRRYATAGELADDLARFEKGEPVHARPVGALGRTLRWSKRNRRLAAALATLALVLLAGAVGVFWQAVHNKREQRRLALESYINNVQAASLAQQQGDYALARRYLAAASPGDGSGPGMDFVWRLLETETASASLLSLHPNVGGILQIAFSPDGSRIATDGDDGTAKWISIAHPDSPAARLGVGGGWALAFSPDEKSCFVGEKRANGEVWIDQVDVASGAVLWSTPGYRASLSGDGSMLAVALGNPVPWVAAEGSVVVWNTATHARVSDSPGDFRSVALSPDGKLLALVPAENRILVRETLSGKELLRLATSGPQLTTAFSPDGRLVASCGQGEASLWLVDGGSLVAKLPHPWLRVWSIAFSPDSRRLATTCSDRAVRIWDTSNGKLLSTLRGHADEVWGSAFSPDGKTLATAGKDGSVLLWPGDPKNDATDISYRGWSRPLFTPDGATLVVSQGGKSPVALITEASGKTSRGPADWAACGISADGKRLLLWSALERPYLRWWSIGQAQFGVSFSSAESLEDHLQMQTGVSSDGTRIFQVGNDLKLRVWDASSGGLVQTFPFPRGSSIPRSFALSREGRRFAWSFEDGNDFWIADLSTGQTRAISGHTNEVNGVAFSPDGELTASASSDGTVRIWDSGTGTQLADIPAQTESVSDVAFSPDGRTLASIGPLQSLKFWNIWTGRELMTMTMPEAGSYLAFSPDGQSMAVTLGDLEGGDDRAVRVLKAPLGAQEAKP